MKNIPVIVSFSFRSQENSKVTTLFSLQHVISLCRAQAQTTMKGLFKFGISRPNVARNTQN